MTVGGVVGMQVIKAVDFQLCGWSMVSRHARRKYQLAGDS
jgi:hypothetical protein